VRYKLFLQPKRKHVKINILNLNQQKKVLLYSIYQFPWGPSLLKDGVDQESHIAKEESSENSLKKENNLSIELKC